MSALCPGCYPSLSGKKSPCTCGGKQPANEKISSKELTTVERVLDGMPVEIVKLMLKEQQEMLSERPTSPVLLAHKEETLSEKIYRRMSIANYKRTGCIPDVSRHIKIFGKRCGQFLSKNLDRLEFRVSASNEFILVRVMSRKGWYSINKRGCLEFLEEQLRSDPLEEIFDPNY